MSKRIIDTRGLVSLIVLFSFIALFISGVVRFVAPQGRIAYWVDWQAFGLSKESWGDIHIVFALLFLVSGVFHIVLNWKSLISYFVSKTSKLLRLRKELVFAVALTAICSFGAVLVFAPFNYLIDGREYFRTRGFEEDYAEPPYGHAEENTLNFICSRLGINPEEACSRLESTGISVGSEDQTLDAIAKDNGVSPAKIYELLVAEPGRGRRQRPILREELEDSARADEEVLGQESPEMLEGEEESHAGSGLGTNSVGASDIGSGFGRETLISACRRLGVDLSIAKERLAQQNITIGDRDRLRVVAARYGVKPGDIARIIRGDSHRQ